MIRRSRFTAAHAVRAANDPVKKCSAGAAGTAVIVAVSLTVWLLSAIGLPAAQRGRQIVRSQLVWVDRAGKKLSAVGELADLGNLELSPDGKRVAVAVLNEATGTRDLWLYDIASGARTRLDENVADENWLIWSPDGGRVIFNSQRTRGLDLYQTRSRAGEPQELLLADDDGKWPVSWSADGRFILYVTSSQGTGNDIWVLPLRAIGSRIRFFVRPCRRTGQRFHRTAGG